MLWLLGFVVVVCVCVIAVMFATRVVPSGTRLTIAVRALMGHLRLDVVTGNGAAAPADSGESGEEPGAGRDEPERS